MTTKQKVTTIEELRRLLDATTMMFGHDGFWVHAIDLQQRHNIRAEFKIDGGGGSRIVAKDLSLEDCECIVAAVNALPKLLDVVKAAEAVIDRWTDWDSSNRPPADGTVTGWDRGRTFIALRAALARLTETA